MNAAIRLAKHALEYRDNNPADDAVQLRYSAFGLLLLTLCLFFVVCIVLGWFTSLRYYLIMVGVPGAALTSLVVCCCTRTNDTRELAYAIIVGLAAFLILAAWVAIVSFEAMFSFTH